MKKLFRALFIIVTLASLQISCDPDDNNPPDDTDPRDKFVGNWTCAETSSLNRLTGSSSYTVSISLNTGNSSQIYLGNFYGLGSTKKVYVVVAGDNATIADQAISGTTGMTARGSGSIYNSNTKIDWTYYVNDGADIDTCTAVFTKQ